MSRPLTKVISVVLQKVNSGDNWWCCDGGLAAYHWLALPTLPTETHGSRYTKRAIMYPRQDYQVFNNQYSNGYYNANFENNFQLNAATQDPNITNIGWSNQQQQHQPLQHKMVYPTETNQANNSRYILILYTVKLTVFICHSSIIARLVKSLWMLC